MKKNILLFSCIALLAASPCSAGMLESLWNKYIPTEDGRPLSPPPSPVDIQKKNSVELLGTFTHNWKYQSTTHELFYEDHRALARSIYGLAIYAGDVDSSLDPQKFIEGVLGYHYRVTQVCAWLNAVVSKKTSSPELDEENLIGVLLSDGVIAIKGGNFVPTGKYSHILAASQGKNALFQTTCGMSGCMCSGMRIQFSVKEPSKNGRPYRKRNAKRSAKRCTNMRRRMKHSLWKSGPLKERRHPV